MGRFVRLLGFVHESEFWCIREAAEFLQKSGDGGVVCSEVLGQESSPGLAELLGLVNTEVAGYKY